MSSGAGQTMHPPEPGRFRCLVCQQTFGRIEHLTRHSRSHSKEHYLKCSYCRKGFYRVDALRRHEAIHKEPKRSALGKGIRACLACAKARRKCSGDNPPCSACEKRSIDCNYPRFRNNTTMPNGEILDGDSMLTSDEQSKMQLTDDRLEVITSPQKSVASWSDVPRSPAAIDKRHIQPSQEDLEQMYDSNDDTSHGVNIATTGSRSIRRDAQQTTRQSQTHRKPHRSPEMPTIIPLSSFLRDPILDFRQGGRPEAWSSSSSGPQPMDVDMSSELARASESNFWPQNGLISINWLPDNWIPDFDFGSGEPPPLNNYSSPTQASQGRSVSIPDTSGSILSHQNSNTPSFNVDRGIEMLENVESYGVGYYYVDGDGARLPRVRKAPHRSPHQSSDSYIPSNGTNSLDYTNKDYGFPGTRYGTQDGAIVTASRIPIEIYNEIMHFFSQTCIDSSYFSAFHPGEFLSLESLEYFVHLYNEHFHPILPFIHPATFSLSGSHWLLVLAMAAIGSHYVDVEDVEVLMVAMHEFLRRTISMVSESGSDSQPNRLLFTQVKLLNCIGMMYCGDQRLVDRAKAVNSDLITFCNTEWINDVPDNGAVSGASVISQTAKEWEAWCRGESHRRTGYSIWLLDCMWSFQFQLRPLLSLEDAKVPVPCQEVLWEAETALDWQQLYSCSTQNSSLHEVIQILYVEKRLQSSMGEFSRILCIHALFRRTWEVETYFKQPLTLWSPAAEKQDIKSKETSSPIWLPGIPTYSKWRNSACDCLDILHWHANSVIGAASGMEHPTVLHLHLARVVLLAPFRQIVELARLMSRERAPKSDPKIDETTSHVRRWAMEDQHKARLAMIHAGVLFWHVRRYSTDGFYEPSSVFLATLALWAYGTFAKHTSGSMGDGPSPQVDDDDAESPFPTSVQLDRPADDELVQLYVKRGGLMRANITGVGNLCSARGPGRVLLEGRKLLVGLKCWGYSRQAVRILGLLAEACQRSQAT